MMMEVAAMMITVIAVMMTSIVMMRGRVITAMTVHLPFSLTSLAKFARSMAIPQVIAGGAMKITSTMMM
jgi:hypothetical protein